MAPRITHLDLNAMDADALKALILPQQQQLLSKDELLLSRDHEIEHLKLLIAKLQRMQFGRKSEKVERQIEQLELKLEELETSRLNASKHKRVPLLPARRVRRPRRSRRAVHFPNISYASPRCMSLRSRHARSVAEHCINWARISPKYSTTFRPASSSSVMCVPS